MGGLRGLAGGFLLLNSGLAAAQGGERTIREIDRWSVYIREASTRFGIPEEWIRRVMRAESGGRTMLNGRPIRSCAGAVGLMQLMPGTWAEMRAVHGLGMDPHKPRDNILAGTAYLRAMYNRFGYAGVFAAYNAGPTRYAEHLASGRLLPAETLAYVAAVGRTLRRRSAAPPRKPQSSGIFVALFSSQPPRPAEAQRSAAQNLLFVRPRPVSAAPE